MKVLIAGATGLIGSQLCKKLQESGHQIHFLTRSQKKCGPGPLGVGFYWDPATGEIDRESLEGVNKIVNLAGASVSKPWTSSHRKAILESRLAAAQTLAAALSSETHTVDQYLTASGISGYTSDPQALYTEADPISNPEFLGVVVREWEAAADRLAEQGVAVTKVRIGLVLANEGGAFPVLAKPVRMGVGSALGSGEQWQSWVHIEDLVSLMDFLLENKLSGVYNGVAPNPVTQKRLLKVLAKALDKPLWMPAAPAFMMKLIMGDRSSLVLDSQRVSSEKAAQNGFEFRHHNIELAIEALVG